MDDMLNILKQRLSQSKSEYDGLLKQLEPLHQKKNLLEDRIKTIEHLISLEQGTTESPQKSIKFRIEESESKELAGKKPSIAYEELIRNYIKDKSFNESNIRNLATVRGLRIKDKAITSSYSRTILLELVQRGILERTERGKYRLRSEIKEF